MIGKFLLLASLALVQGRPSDVTNEHVTAHDLCPKDLRHYLLPHEYDCTKFYYCEYGLKWETPRDCAPGTEFSYELQVCVHPELANCQLPGVPDPEPETEAPKTEAPETEAPETEAPETEAPETKPTTSAPASTEASIISTSTTTAAPSSTEAAVISTLSTTSAPSSTEASVISTSSTTAAPSSTEAAVIVTSTTTAAPSSTEPAVTSTAAPETIAPIVIPEPEETDGETLENGCPADWDVHRLLPHEDCDKFYQCAFGEKIIRDCAPGTLFNPDAEVCDHPENVECGERNVPEEEDDNDNEADSSAEKPDWLPNGCPGNFDVHQLLPHESDCSRFYYCVFGEKVERQCAPGTHFNAQEQVCDWPEVAGCKLGNGGEDNGDSHGNGDGDNGSEDGGHDNGDGDNGTEDGDNNGVLPNGCPADFDIHQLLPHESDCGKFYQCNFGKLVERQCPGGTHFNPTEQVCDWPEAAGCQASGNGGEDNVDNNGSGDGDIGTEDGGNGDGDNGTEDGDNNGVLPNGCPADFDIHQLLPHESDCGKFYQCNFGKLVERQCPGGTHFNPTEQVCDWPEAAGCQAGGNGGEDNVDNNGSGDGDIGTEDGGNGDGDNGTEDGDNNGVLPNGCPADFDIHQLLPHESDCGKFYQCNFGKLVERQCPGGTHFNPTEQVCDWPEAAGCQAGGNEGEDNGDSHGNGDGDSGSEDGGHDNGDGDNGTEDGDNNGVLPNGCPADFDVHQLLPHESDCGKFYQCNFGELVERQCPGGTHFNPSAQVCDWPEAAGCQAGGNGGEGSSEGNGDGDGDGGEEDGNGDGDNGGEDGNGDGDNGGEDENGDGDNNGGEDSGNGHGETSGEDGDNGSGDGDNGNGETEIKPDHSKCADSCNILPWAHETSCDKYWKCVGETAVLAICSEGLHFNPHTGNCDFICNAGCVRRYMQTTADHEGLKIFVPWDKVDDNMRRTYVPNEL